MENGNLLKKKRKIKQPNSRNKFVLLIGVYIVSSIFTHIFAQENYSFKVENPVRYKFDPFLYDGISFEFYGKRITLNKNEFYETSVLREVDTLKVCKRKWYLKDKGTWKLFFSENKFQKKSVIQWKSLYLIPVKKIIEREQEYYLYYLYHEKYLNPDKEQYYAKVYFNSKDGIMKVQYEKFSLCRKWLK